MDSLLPISPLLCKVPSRRETANLEFPRPAATRDLKILIASSPKTGNTWLKYLLSEIYDIPAVDIPFDVNAYPLANLGPCWVGHQHFLPTEPLLRQIDNLGIHVITTMRHPADLLVSLFHWIRSPSGEGRYPQDPALRMKMDGNYPGEQTLDFVRQYFATYPAYSAAWLNRCGHVVRYEDLLEDPPAVLTRLTQAIVGVDARTIQIGVANCELSRLRERFPDIAHHFRRGSTQQNNPGERLPPEIVQVLASESPYPQINAHLGYSFGQPRTIAHFDYRAIDPFYRQKSFSNGAPVIQPIQELYLKYIPDARTRWPDPVAAEGSGSFFNHLCQPVDDQLPAVPHLANYIYWRRIDLQKTFPDHLGKNRMEFFQWVITQGVTEYAIPQVFLLNALESLLVLSPPPLPESDFTYRVAIAPSTAIVPLSCYDSDGVTKEAYVSGEQIVFALDVPDSVPDAQCLLSMEILSESGQLFFSTELSAKAQIDDAHNYHADRRIEVTVHANLPNGRYLVTLFGCQALMRKTSRNWYIEGRGQFTVTSSRNWQGLAQCNAILRKPK